MFAQEVISSQIRTFLCKETFKFAFHVKWSISKYEGLGTVA